MKLIIEQPMDLYTAELVNQFIADLEEVQVPIMLFVCPDAEASEPPKINIDLTTETEDIFYGNDHGEEE